MSKKRKKRIKLVLLIIVILLFALGIYFLAFKVLNINSQVIDTISKYNYTLEKRDTDIMKNTFEKLKEVLSKKEIDDKEYAKLLSQLFIIDLYTINNKDNSYDIGSVEYIFEDHQDNFRLKVQDTLYKYLTIKSKRKIKMPEVKSVTVDNIKDTKYKYADKEYSGYEITLSWKYTKDLGYDKSGNVIVAKINDKLYITDYTTEVIE